MSTAELDHIVVAGATLAQAIEYVADLTGVAPRPGGQHVAMGTHNALVRLGTRVYLELIAIDPGLPRPARPRWFDLDDAAMQAEIGDRPRVVHWVERTSDIERASAGAKVDPVRVHPMSRGDFRWRIGVPADGRPPLGGLLPALIEWDGERHPADGLPESGCELMKLEGFHPEAGRAREALRVTYGAAPRLAAMLRTPRGLVTL